MTLALTLTPTLTLTPNPNPNPTPTPTPKQVGSNSLDGLSLGCDHTGVFFLTGMIAELRLYSCHMPAAQRVQTEAALARRYSLDYTDAPVLPPSPSRGLGRFASCMPRYSEGEAASTAAP